MTTGRDLCVERYDAETWNELPDHIRRLWDVAARERDNPRICANCGRNADFHSGAHNAGCRFTPINAAKAAVGSNTQEEA